MNDIAYITCNFRKNRPSISTLVCGYCYRYDRCADVRGEFAKAGYEVSARTRIVRHKRSSKRSRPSRKETA